MNSEEKRNILDKIYKNVKIPMADLNNTVDKILIYNINESNKDCDYRCPICGQRVSPIAWNEENRSEKSPTPYFRHNVENGNKCAETYIHYLYTTFLMTEKCKFIIDGVEYETKSAEQKQPHKTKLGDYIPDITVQTTSNKVFYFEILNTNPKKKDDYLLKWNELGNDVVEVDVLKMQDEIGTNNIPEFKLIYSNGEYLKPEYKKRDRSMCLFDVYKEEIKRKDTINYKIRYMKLDEFWLLFQRVFNMKSTFREVEDYFNTLSLEDMNFCFEVIKGHKFINKDRFREMINDKSHYTLISYVGNMSSLNAKIDLIFKIKKEIGLKVVVSYETNPITLKDTKSIIIENRKHYIEYSNVINLIDKLNEYLNHIKIAKLMIDKLNSYCSWDKYPLLYNELNIYTFKLDKKYLGYNNFRTLMRDDLSEDNYSEVLEELNNKYINYFKEYCVYMNNIDFLYEFEDYKSDKWMFEIDTYKRKIRITRFYKVQETIKSIFEIFDYYEYRLKDEDYIKSLFIKNMNKILDRLSCQNGNYYRFMRIKED